MAETTIVAGTTERGEPDTPIVEPSVFVLLAPDLATMQTFQWDWVAIVYGRNLALTFLVFGGLRWRFYMKNTQDERYMLNRKAPTVSHRRLLASRCPRV
jgi:hypothetical protein